LEKVAVVEVALAPQMRSQSRAARYRSYVRRPR
jgi:hypothetical protein